MRGLVVRPCSHPQPGHAFVAKYEHARRVQAQVNVDDIHDIADTQEYGEIVTERIGGAQGDTYETKRVDLIEHRKLRIAARQWTAEKLLPKVYGARQTIEHQGGINVTLGSDEELLEELLHLVTTGRLLMPAGVQLEVVDDEQPQGEDDDYSDIC
jgi:hypothetical protein